MCIKLIDLCYKHPRNIGRNCHMEYPLRMYLELIPKIKTQRHCRCTPRQRETTNLGTSPSEHPVTGISCLPQIDSGQRWPQWPFLQAVPLGPVLLSRTAMQKPGVHGNKIQSSPLLYSWLVCHCQETTATVLTLYELGHRRTYGLVL